MALRRFNELFEILIMRVAIYGRKITKQSLPAFNEVFDTVLSFGWSVLAAVSSADPRHCLAWVKLSRAQGRCINCGVSFRLGLMCGSASPP